MPVTRRPLPSNLLNNGERQVAPDVSGIRRDHVARYEFAARTLPENSHVLDLACGIGYGAKILAEAGHTVTAVDASKSAIRYARKHYAHPSIRFVCRSAEAHKPGKSDRFDAVVSFETIEHIENPAPVIEGWSDWAELLIASAPNEEVFPFRCEQNEFRGWAFHHRHYTRKEFRSLLSEAGYRVTGTYGQEGPESEVEKNRNGRTVVMTAKRKVKRKPEKKPVVQKAKPDVPEHVAIVGLGPSMASFVEVTKRIGGSIGLCDEVWGINAGGDVLRCDRIFHMDDVRVQEARAEANPQGNIACMLKWMRKHPGPIYTSAVRPGYPGLVEYPLEDVINAIGHDYFNNTAAYAVAYAIYIGVKKISLFGIDFSYPNMHHAERGRGNVEFLLGIASAKGIKIAVPSETSLLDSCEPSEHHHYGYDAFDVKVEAVNGMAKVTLTPKDALPTAAEIEKRYDHSKHPSALMRDAVTVPERG